MDKAGLYKFSSFEKYMERPWHLVTNQEIRAML